jgi:hypothetical protein
MTTMIARFLLVGALFCTLLGRAQTSSPDGALTETQITNSKLPVLKSPWCISVPVKVSLVPAKDRRTVCAMHGLAWAQCQDKKMELACPCYQEPGPPPQPSAPHPSLPPGPFISCGEALLVNGHDLHREQKLAQNTAKKNQPPRIVECVIRMMPTGQVKEAGQDDSHCRPPKKGEVPLQGPQSPFG